MAYTISTTEANSERTTTETWTDENCEGYYDYIDGFGKYTKVPTSTLTYIRKKKFKQSYFGPKNMSAIHSARWAFEEVDNPQSSCTVDKITYHGRASQVFGAAPGPGAYVDSNTLMNQVNNQVRMKLKDQKVNLPLIIAESRKTANMFASVASSVAKAIIQAKRNPASLLRYARAPIDNRRGILDAITTAQLTTQYGIKPLLMDLDGSIRALAELSYKPTLITVSSKSSNTATSRNVTRPWDSKTTRDCTYLATFSYKVWIEAIVDPGFSQRAGQFGMVNPLEVAWELVPYSFVVDWLLPIGDTLQQLDATYGLGFSRGYSTSKSVDEFKYASYSQKKTQYSRLKLAAFPGISVTFSPDLSGQRVANAMSLLYKAISK